MRRALRAEWVKAMSDRGTAWLLAALVTLSVAVSVLSVAAARCPAAGCGQDPARISLTGVYLGQVVAALAGVLVIGGEYGTGMIRVTLAAVPRRGRLLAAKAIVVAALVLAASALAVGASMLAGRLILPGHGFTPASGFSLAAAGWWRASLCGAADITLIALLGLGIAAAVRDSAAATGITLGVLYLFPVAAGLVQDPALQRHLQQIGPLAAGLDSQATAGLSTLPLSPWQGLGVVALWAAGALILGVVVLRQRDA
jgi:ABC-2 type transport system permease protein